MEVGRRLAAAHWGRGYATERAGAAVRYGFETLGGFLVDVALHLGRDRQPFTTE